MKKVLFVVTSHDRLGDTGRKTGVYLSEVTHVWHVLKEAGCAIDFMTPKGGQPPVDGADSSDSINQAFVGDADAQRRFNNSSSPGQVTPADYAAIYFAGGHGTMWDFPDNEALARLAAQVYEAGGVVAALCHGVAGLVNVKLSNGKYLVEGKTVSSYTNEEEELAGVTRVVPFLLESRLVERGARHRKAAPRQAHVEVDERLVTGQNPASALSVGREIVRLLAN